VRGNLIDSASRHRRRHLGFSIEAGSHEGDATFYSRSKAQSDAFGESSWFAAAGLVGYITGGWGASL
jgi:hypothetical protein